MTGYRRLISYIYAYEGEEKGKNIGFVKLESRNGQCRLSVNVKKIYAGGNDIGVYLIASGQEIPLGNIFIRNGCGEFRTIINVENVMGTGNSLDSCIGLVIYEKGEEWRVYKTVWEDAVAQAAELELAEAAEKKPDDTQERDKRLKKKIEELNREIDEAAKVGDNKAEKENVEKESAQTEAQKSSDMFAKCQYLDELTGGKGITFATGTPISNSMTELYTNMRYLQYGTLQKMGLGHFDSWAASFGETQTAIELAPEGTGYRAKTRFAKFFNLPELIALFKESADIQTPDMLKLPVPEAEYENVVLKPSEYQKEMVTSLADRAEAVRNRLVEPHQDNMLKITNDGRKLALDQRLINDMLPDEEHSKAKTCVDKAFEIWEDTKGEKSAQLIFCDLSTPKGDGTFNVYEDIRNKLMEKGVPAEEIAFIHQANTELRKAELFSKVRSGQVRFLLGSTAKMGAGTNVQDRLIALHHLDVPWRPSDIEQQEGRILRQGNRNPKVKIFRYVTEGTFDSYSWQLIENKQKFIGQIMTSKSPVRSCEDVDEAALSYAEVKALATGNPYIKEKMDLDIQVSKLKLMKANHTSQKYRLEDNIAKHYPQQITILKERISGLQADIQTAKTNLPADKEFFSMRVGNKVYTDKKEAGTALVEMCKEIKSVNAPAVIGEYAGFKMAVSFDSFNHKFVMNIKGQLSHNLEIGVDPLGNISRINHALEAMTKELAEASTKLENVERQLETAKVEVTKPFAQEAELSEKLDRLSALNALLNMDEKGDDGIGMEDDKSELGTEQVADTRKPYPIENTRHNYAVENGNPQGMRLTAAMADKPAQRVSLKEKLETMKVKAAGNNIENSVQRDKGKEEYL